LKISHTGDKYEQEADKVADQVIRMSSSYSTSSPVKNKEERIDRKCAACEMTEQEEEEKMAISRKLSSATNTETADKVTSGVNNIRSGSGSLLDPSTREFMEFHFTYEFSKVRIHTGERAARSACSLSAIAYTIGNDIVFGEEQYHPNTTEGRRLLAHELVHVIQQNTWQSSHLLQ
jgi:Domain of unknown function (DUF4157)